MKISPKAEAALRQPDTNSIAIEMTPERKAKFKALCDQIVDMLKARTENPLEAYMVLQFVIDGFESAYGIRAGIIFGDNEDAPR